MDERTNLYRLEPSGEFYPMQELEAGMLDWSRFQQAVEVEESLFAHPSKEFFKRYRNGVLSVYVDGNLQVIATCGASMKSTPMMREVVPTLANWRIIEMGTSWIAQEFREKGVFRKIRCAKIIENEPAIFFSQTYGIGIRRILKSEDWVTVEWAEIPFVSSLMGWVDGCHFILSNGLKIKKKIMDIDIKYNDAIDLTENYHHLWCRSQGDLNAAHSLELALSQDFPGRAGLLEFRDLVRSEFQSEFLDSEESLSPRQR